MTMKTVTSDTKIMPKHKNRQNTTAQVHSILQKGWLEFNEACLASYMQPIT